MGFINAFAVKLHAPTLAGHESHQSFEQFSSSCAQQTIDSDDFAFTEAKRHVIKLIATARMKGCETLYG